MTREECEAKVNRPGKFERQAPYVPFYWEVYLDGFASRDNGRELGFKVSAADRIIFPELKGRQWVTLVETDQGFVVEV